MLGEIACARQTYDAAFQGTHGAFSEDAAYRLLPSSWRRNRPPLGSMTLRFFTVRVRQVTA